MNEKPLEIYIFYCSNCLDTDALNKTLAEHGQDSAFKPIGLPCSGKLELVYMLKSFESGADGAILATCRKGECRFLEGNLRAEKRCEAVEALLEETGFGRGRMRLVQMARDELGLISDELDNLTATIRDG
ncbi:MAG: hydrogenase iron-sulfur subunit [Thermodesulfobacteriota bacterium]|nr:hydrogenase iron-sulfur subunit [Thermodesulfobacteriota bacterium]